MNVAVIFAGGVGKRMNSQSTPKQFLKLHGKPIIIYTLEVFQNSSDVDAICISCLGTHIEYMRSLCQEFGISKVRWIVEGGASGQESIFNGLSAVHADCPADTVVMMHDGVRPIISTDLIRRNVESVLRYGNAVSCSRATETPAEVDEDGRICKISDRSVAVIAKAPQSFYLQDIFCAHLKSKELGLADFIDSASMMCYYGHELHMVESPWDNIKITTPSDFYIFKAIIEAKENSQIFGL